MEHPKEKFGMKNTILLFAIVLSLSVWSQTYTGKLGYGLSPQGFPVTYNQLPAFYQDAANTCGGGVVMANGSWRDSLAASGVLPALHKMVSNAQPNPYAYSDMLVFGWAAYPLLYLDAPTDATNNWSNASTKNLFLQTLRSAADSLKPAYLFIGNEINFYWEQDSSDFLNWSAFYSQAYDTIKKYSPATQVGTIYNYEDLSGLGALTGWTTPRWNSLTAMDTSKMDVIGFTVYPFLSVSAAGSLPPGYFNPLFNHIGNKPFVITETGWPADSTEAGALWDASPSEQVTYINKLFTLLNGQNVEDVNWLFLNYLMSHNGSENIFRSVALRDSLGNDRPALPVWLSMCNQSAVSHVPQESEVGIYPNPFEETIHIEMPRHEEASILLCDILGNTLFQLNTDSKHVVIEPDLIPGIYFLSISQSGKNIVTKKIVRQ